ncbi:MAG: hypothetical protein R2798_11380 [Chitinophagales bacterium]|nr:hypothetical protein [Bacteroidota bacterium]
MKKNLLIIILCLFSFGVNALKAQETDGNKDVEVIIFNDESAGENLTKKAYSAWVIKTNPVSFILGKQQLIVEKTLNGTFSVLLGAGVTFKNVVNTNILDFIKDDFEGRETTFNAPGEVDYGEEYNSDYAPYSVMGPMFSGSIRLYFDSDSPEGAFLSATISHITFKENVQGVKEVLATTGVPSFTGDTYTESKQNVSFTVRFGNQIVYDRITLESFIGVGVMSQTIKTLDVGRDANYYWRNRIRTQDAYKPQAEFGVRVGVIID